MNNTTDQVSDDYTAVAVCNYSDVFCLRTLHNQVTPDVWRMFLGILILLNTVQCTTRNSKDSPIGRVWRAIHTDQFSGTSSQCQFLVSVAGRWIEPVTGTSEILVPLAWHIRQFTGASWLAPATGTRKLVSVYDP